MENEERVELIMAFEDGTIYEGQFIKLFQDLIDTRLAWKLQGIYGRTAQALIEKGYIKKKGGDEDGN